VADFAHDVREELARYLAPAEVCFRGSFERGSHDEYSDVDLRAEVRRALDGRFWSTLEDRLMGLYGPALVRYDPDFRGLTTSQNVRFSFFGLPVFWRVDLTVISGVDPGEKWPSPFPEWSSGTSALMNVIWAIKHHGRGDDESANHYLASACGKLDHEKLVYSTRNVLAILDHLGAGGDTDELLLAKTREAVSA